MREFRLIEMPPPWSLNSLDIIEDINMYDIHMIPRIYI